MATAWRWCLKGAAGAVPKCFQSLHSSVRRTPRQAQRQEGYSQGCALDSLKFGLLICFLHRRHTLCWSFPLQSLFSIDKQEQKRRQCHHRPCGQLATVWAIASFSEDTVADFNFRFYFSLFFFFFSNQNVLVCQMN